MNQPPDQYPFLDQPLEDLGISDDFCRVLKVNKISTMREAVEVEAHHLLGLPGFGYRMMHEFIALLERHKAAHLLQE
jgi:DNA-directed RNA polymerase alpha subunit